MRQSPDVSQCSNSTKQNWDSFANGSPRGPCLHPAEPDVRPSSWRSGLNPTRTSIAEMGEHWTKLPMISTLDDICWKWSKRASSTSIVASLYRLAVVPFHLLQQWDRNVA
jgi:hypothetical protein